MMNQKDRLDSPWEIPVPFAGPPLTQNKLTEVCVIGGGIAGLSSAYQLAKRGHDVTVVDAFAMGSGQTGRTTAHLSSQLEGPLRELLKRHGPETIGAVHRAHAEAIDVIEHLVETEAIHCDFRRLDGFYFTGAHASKRDLLLEQEAASACGIALEYVDRVPLLAEDLPALKYTRQAQFHPMKYLQGLLRVLGELNVSLYEGTGIAQIDFNEQGMAVLTTDLGLHINARHVVIATDTPVGQKLGVHTRQYAYRTYAMAFELLHPRDPVLLWDTEDPYHYVRLADDQLIVGGEDHRTGQHPGSDPFQRLTRWTRDKFSVAGEVRWKWSGQVFEPMDQLPFIGRAPHLPGSVFIVTGASGLGMTTGTIASILLPELIIGNTHPWESIFDPSRPMKAGLKDFVLENVNVALQYKDWLTPSEVKSKEDIPEDTGTVMREGLSKTCVYHESQDNFERKSAVCTHLGGIVHWNDIEKTWDCPCHGSRFNTHGKVIEGPAISGLTEK